MLPSAVGLPVSILCTTSAAPVFAHLGHRPPESDLHSRQLGDVKPLILERHQGSYFVRAKVGYPGQVLSLQLRNDAGAITYVPSSNASTCISGKCTMGARKFNKQPMSLGLNISRKLMPNQLMQAYR